MLKNFPQRIVERTELTVEFDSSDRKLSVSLKWIKALEEKTQAREVFETLVSTKLLVTLPN
ncbi:hypothetical protein [Pilibacter termitis]|uniref:hypothetical protein n=1 Tax=Pilibacter termitis TaxID=263852 RepID=UPI00099A49D6|nr:hypothetical protein [Pilibacter termitis]